MDQLQKRIALKFRLNKIDNAGIYGPILLNTHEKKVLLIVKPNILIIRKQEKTNIASMKYFIFFIIFFLILLQILFLLQLRRLPVLS